MFFSADVTVHLIFWKFIIVEEDWLQPPLSKKFPFELQAGPAEPTQ